MKPSATDIRNRELLDKLAAFDPLHPKCIFCGSGWLNSHERRGFALIMVFYCRDCKKRFEKVVKKKLTKSRESYNES